MKTSNYLSMTVILLITLFANSCTVYGDEIKPSKNYITRTYEVKDFSKIQLTTVGDVYYTQSTDGTTSLSVYGPDNIVPLIKVSIDNGTLVLTMDKKSKVKNINKMKITISSPDLSAVKFSGVGSIHIEEGLTTHSLDLRTEGVGNIYASSLKCDELTVSSKGVGDVKVSGEANNVSLTSEGVGNIKAGKLMGRNVKARSKGIGNITCHAIESIAATVEGIGSVKYSGNPTTKNNSSKGIGSIKNI